MESNERIEQIHSGALSRPGTARGWDLNTSSSEGQSILTWEQAVRVLRKHQLLLAGILVLLTAATAALALLLPNTYRPVARIEIDPLEGGITTLHEIQNAKSEADQDYLDTQVQILQSEGLAMRVIRALQLDQNPEFARQKQNTAAAESPA